MSAINAAMRFTKQWNIAGLFCASAIKTGANVICECIASMEVAPIIAAKAISAIKR